MLDWKRFSFFELVCHMLMWLLRPFAVPLETLLHRRVGERAPGLASLVGLAVMELFIEGQKNVVSPSHGR